MASPVPTLRRGPRRLLAVLGAILALVVAVSLGAGFWTDLLWYRSVDHQGVYWRVALWAGGLFVLGFAASWLVVAGALRAAYRSRPARDPEMAPFDPVEKYRQQVAGSRRLLMLGIPTLVGLFIGLASASAWREAMLWWHREPFGEVDPQFGHDIGFYLFTVPLLGIVVDLLLAVLLIALVGSVTTHYLAGALSVRRHADGHHVTPAAALQIGALVAAALVTKGLDLLVGRWELTTVMGPRTAGPGYTDVHARLPMLAILALTAVLLAGVVLWSARRRVWKLPVAGLAVLVVTSLVGLGIYPALLQRFLVDPSAASREAPYIQRGIDATRAAYGIEDVEVVPYDARTAATEDALAQDRESIPGVRLMDPAVISRTVKQLQGIRNYYQFPEALDVDRYEVDGEPEEHVVAVRELDLDGLPASQRNWVNDHTVFTHGFGMVAADSSEKSAKGEPVFTEQNIPPTQELGGEDYEPRVYFGEFSPEYSIVGAPEGAEPRELDHPDGSDTGQRNTTYDGSGGVPVGNWFNRLAYAITYGEGNFLLADAFNSESRLLDHRTPRERVERVAPWLTLDGDAFPTVVDGRIVWVVDGYTTSTDYPYSETTNLEQATADGATAQNSNLATASGRANYLRNSVKATVDAYDGSVTLYAWDEEDPMLKAWRKAFPGTVKPRSEISGELMSHLRYPQDLFKAQREMLQRYHVTSAGAFFGGQDFWRVPPDPTQDDERVQQPPYYLGVQMPGQEEPRFSLTSTFKPVGEREVLSGFLAVDADAGSQAGTPRDGYGDLRMLELPRETSVPGPGQVQNDLTSSNTSSKDFSQTLSQFLSLNQQRGSDVEFGNQLTLPVGGGVLYVEPIYVRSTGDSSYPLLRLVVVAFGNELAWGDTLDSALEQLFSQDGGSGDGKGDGDGGQSGDGKGDDSSGATDEKALAEALQDAEDAMKEADEALEEGDFAAYGKAQEKLRDAIERATKASPEGGRVTVDPSAEAPEPQE
ncbi:UPF0182 family membrane protein [Kytococcus sp. Marseille-QA3725]